MTAFNFKIVDRTNGKDGRTAFVELNSSSDIPEFIENIFFPGFKYQSMESVKTGDSVTRVILGTFPAGKLAIFTAEAV